MRLNKDDEIVERGLLALESIYYGRILAKQVDYVSLISGIATQDWGVSMSKIIE